MKPKSSSSKRWAAANELWEKQGGKGKLEKIYINLGSYAASQICIAVEVVVSGSFVLAFLHSLACGQIILCRTFSGIYTFSYIHIHTTVAVYISFTYAGRERGKKMAVLQFTIGVLSRLLC